MATVVARVLDGNRLAGTEHRVPVTRTTRAAALPGQALVVLDPAAMLSSTWSPARTPTPRNGRWSIGLAGGRAGSPVDRRPQLLHHPDAFRDPRRRRLP